MILIMKLISWNVNGIRSVMTKGFLDYVASENPEIFCLQETKIDHSLTNIKHDAYPYVYWNCADKKGYSGTAIFSKIKPLDVHYGLKMEHHDKEGRIITLEFSKFYLVTVYTPNAKRELERLKYRQEWDADFLRFVKNLEKTKPVIFCGDLNVAHQEIDLANPKTNHRNAGFTDEEREGFDNILSAGFIDTFRVFNKEPNNYTWWSYMFHARAKNIGWRIDYFVISKSLISNLKGAFIREKILGSDHCPVGIEMEL